MQGFRPKQQYGQQMSPNPNRRAKIKRVRKSMDPSKPRNLSFVNLSNDEINFISSLKIDLIQLQEEIDRLDIDGLLRNPKINTFTKYAPVCSILT